MVHKSVGINKIGVFNSDKEPEIYVEKDCYSKLLSDDEFRQKFLESYGKESLLVCTIGEKINEETYSNDSIEIIPREVPTNKKEGWGYAGYVSATE